ncbi:hypothetical protein D0Z07_1903 [Hyphodiscus hymeniophilus]|uniref:CorA-like transporter domain-containing protein n=1 Tax=Hyphodiscus hymeniophilus TaxID=353542 RepID=A0A9P6VPE5_9HELO|nr:hypothetical protein D0Z07_1903 [Hyphodiscus hymeniophilus]
MSKVLTHHDVDPQFLDLLMSFATGNKESEVGPGRMTVKHHSKGSYEMQYRLSYVEEIQGAGLATRQTGVFHRFVPDGRGSLWIFLNPRPNSNLQTRLGSVVRNSKIGRACSEEWELVHLLVLSSYLGDWRWYLKSLSAEIERIASISLAVDFSKESQYGRGTETLQDLHNLQDKVLPLSPRLRSTLATVNSLKLYVETLRAKDICNEELASDFKGELECYDVLLDGHLSSVALLEKRIQEILNLLGVALNLKSQTTAVKINRNIWNLTKDSVDDNATVKLVTIVTLIYLPASFMASILGMNLFVFQSADSSDFQISKQFWVFIVLTIPLTLITVGSWIIMARRRRKQKNKEREEQIMAGGGQEEV